ncbi:MAG: AMP-binding protein [Roseovarius indicus]
MNVREVLVPPLSMADLEHPLPRRFAQVAGACADRPAIIDDSRTVTYAELQDLAGRYGAFISRHVAPGEPVALCMRTNRHVVAAMLGALMAGRPYVPLDPAYPADHLARVVRHSGAGLVIGHVAEDLAALAGVEGPAVETVTSMDVLEASGTGRFEARPEAAAYVIYTSGSTGVPKGVWQDQRGLLHDILQYSQVVQPGHADRHSLLYSPCVNGALRDIYGSVLNGATLCMSDLRREGLRAVLRSLTDRRVTLLHAMPPVLRSLARVADGPICPEARVFYTAGDRFLTQDLLAARASLPEACEIYTGIGSTECATLYRHWIVPRTFVPEGELVPVGFLVEDREMRLVDEAGQGVADGEIGQIRVCSPYIARGYWKDEALTREMFRPDPERPGWRCFQPGDLGRERPDGLLEFLGRADRQIKIRGYRIEPAEIEAALRRIDGVAEAAIVPEERMGKTSLIGFVEPVEGAALDGAALRDALAQALPPQLLPSRVIVLDALPRLGNLKLDVKAMRAMLTDEGRAPAGAAELPDGYMALWEKVFKRPVDADMALEALSADSLELLELELLLERDLKVSVRDAIGPEATPRTVWAQAVPAPERRLTRYGAIDDRLNALASLMARSNGIALDPDGLVRLHNHGGSRMPLMWCFNQVREANALAAALGPDQPLIAMRSLAGLYTGDRPPPHEERQVAEHYVGIVLGRDLPQRVVVGGNCQAAPLAFYMANALALSGHGAASLVLLEKLLPVPYAGRALILFGRDSRLHNPSFQFAEPTAAWGRYLSHGQTALVDGSHGKFFDRPNVGSLAGALRAEIDRAGEVGWLPERARRVVLKVAGAPDGRAAVHVGNPNEVDLVEGARSRIGIAIHALGPEEADARPARVPDLTVPLPRRVAAGESADVEVALPPDRHGTGRYVVSLCEEGVGWFALLEGSAPILG